jgi:glutamate synthase domain-containing protein 3
VLDDAEKAEKEHLKESTDSEKTKEMIAKWEEYRNCVKTVLPVTLDLVISAARGQFDLKNVRTCASQLLCRSFSVELPVQLRQLLRLANALPALPAEVGAVLAPQVEKPEEKQPPLSQSLSPPAPTEVPPNAEPEPPKELDTQEEVQPAPPADQEKSESA